MVLFFPGVLLMFLQQFASKTIFLTYIRLLAILRGSRRGSDKAEALKEVFGCLDAHSQTEFGELVVCGPSNRFGTTEMVESGRSTKRSVTGTIWLSCLKRSVWKYILEERVEDNDDFS